MKTGRSCPATAGRASRLGALKLFRCEAPDDRVEVLGHGRAIEGHRHRLEPVSLIILAYRLRIVAKVLESLTESE